MIDKFSAFDDYQLAKYNKEKSRLKKDKNLKVNFKNLMNVSMITLIKIEGSLFPVLNYELLSE